jgi:enoyl-CoA hydratase/carnithine racemase
MVFPEYATLGISAAGEHALVVTLNRPAALNALNTRMGEELHELLQRIATSPEAPRCVVLTGAGGRAFCAGADLKERQGMTGEAWRAQHEVFERMYAALMELPLPAIAALNGHAFGGGLEIALACDFIFAARGARCALPEAKLGIMPGGGGTQNLSRAVGARRAKELIFTGRAFSAEEGERWGLFNRVCEPGALLGEALTAAGEIAANAPLSVRQAKRAILRGTGKNIHDAYLEEIEAYHRLVDTEDRREGVAAFNAKRKPGFCGR